jgi:hypothetical protein
MVQEVQIAVPLQIGLVKAAVVVLILAMDLVEHMAEAAVVEVDRVVQLAQFVLFGQVQPAHFRQQILEIYNEFVY